MTTDMKKFGNPFTHGKGALTQQQLAAIDDLHRGIDIAMESMECFFKNDINKGEALVRRYPYRKQRFDLSCTLYVSETKYTRYASLTLLSGTMKPIRCL